MKTWDCPACGKKNIIGLSSKKSKINHLYDDLKMSDELLDTAITINVEAKRCLKQFKR